MKKPTKNVRRVREYKAPFKDFKCSCACGQKIRVVFHAYIKGQVVDISILQPKQKKPKFGVVLRSDEKNSLKEFKKFLISPTPKK